MATRSLSERQLQAAGIRLTDSAALYPALHRDGEAGLPMLVVEAPNGQAVIALQGAHLMSFRPQGQDEWLWVSPQCVLKAGQPIRGGIPLCLPWFGPAADGRGPQHGFARIMDWTPVEAERSGEGDIRLLMELSSDVPCSDLWPHPFVFRLELTVGEALTLKLSAENRGNRAAPLAFAFHTYFSVPDVANASISGLEHATYIDKMDGLALKRQDGEVTIRSITDRVYLDVAAHQTLHTGRGDIGIDSDTRCAVVWNAWNNDANIPDLGAGNHVGYLCVERGDVAERAIELAPGEAYTASMTLAAPIRVGG